MQKYLGGMAVFLLIFGVFCKAEAATFLNDALAAGAGAVGAVWGQWDALNVGAVGRS